MSTSTNTWSSLKPLLGQILDQPPEQRQQWIDRAPAELQPGLIELLARLVEAER